METRNIHSLQLPCLVLLSLIASLLPSVARSQSLVINEVMSSNGMTILDEDGQSPDWIEFYNAGNSSIQLEG